MPLIAALAWVALEYLRSILFTGFPWGLLGSSQYHWLTLIQVADITSIYGISFMIVLTNGVLAQWAQGLIQVWQVKGREQKGQMHRALDALLPLSCMAFARATCRRG